MTTLATRFYDDAFLFAAAVATVACIPIGYHIRVIRESSRVAAVVVEDAYYDAVKAELRGICEALCGPVLVWLPEGDKPRSCNFAFLYADEYAEVGD